MNKGKHHKMNRQKIVFYFTPDISLQKRDLSWMEASKNKSKGLYILSFGKVDESIIKDATCNSIKSAQESTATINLVGIYGGYDTDDLFFVNDYFEIWDEANNWCHFRGMLRNKNRTVGGSSKDISLDLVNAGGWVFNDRSIYYINPVVASSFGVTKSTLFTGLKTKYGLLNKTIQQEISDIFTKDTTPNKYLEFLVNKICNVRIGSIRKDFFSDSIAVKDIVPEADINFNDRRILVSRRKSQVEGAIWDALKMFEGYPFCQMFIEEGEQQTRIKWRYSRWRDNTGRLCMDTLAEDKPPIVLYADDKAEIEEDELKGIIDKQENETITGIVNAFFLTPWSSAKLSNSLAQQISAVGSDPTIVLDEKSILRNGYIPQELKIPFLPESIAGVLDHEFDDDSPSKNRERILKRTKTVGEELVFYTKILKRMYTEYKRAKTGSLIFKNNLPIPIGRDIELVESELSGDVRTHMSLNKITQYFDGKVPRTILEYSRGFKKIGRNVIS